jgi:CheY-like chemotaxis protein
MLQAAPQCEDAHRFAWTSTILWYRYTPEHRALQREHGAIARRMPLRRSIPKCHFGASAAGATWDTGILFRMDDDASQPRSALVAVVDDDESVRESLPALLRSFQLEVCAFCCAEDFLASAALTAVDCLVLDVAMPRMTGFELQSILKARHLEIPTVFITARAENDARTRILGTGAVDCLFKPFSAEALLRAVDAALARR